MTQATRPGTASTIILVSALVAFGALSSDIYLPSLPSMAADLKTTPGLVQQTLTIFLFCYAVSQLVYGPLSDRCGRRHVLFAGLTIFLSASIACVLAETVEALLVLRIVQALGACAGAVVGRAIVRDLYDEKGASRVLAYIAMTMMLTPILAPIIGGWLEVTFGWRANFVFMAAFAAIVFIAVKRYLPETIRARDPTALNPQRIANNYLTLLSDSRFLGYSLTATFGFAGLWAFITSSSFVLIDLVGLTPREYAMAFAAMSAGFALGSFASARLAPRLGLNRSILLGIAIYGVAAVTLNIIAASGVLTTLAICGPTILMAAGNGLLLANCQAGAIGPFPHMAGAASALMGFLMMGGSSLIGSVVAVGYNATQFPMVGAALFSAVFLSLSFYLLVWKRTDSVRSIG